LLTEINNAMSGSQMAEPSYRVQAFNSATHSENRMHDDAVAQKYGFSGGLVPGVDVFAYMVHVPVAKWGRAFLERGLMEVRFAKPVYDGETVVVTSEPSDDGLAISGLTRSANGSERRRAPGRANLERTIGRKYAKPIRSMLAKGWCIPVWCSGL
jgi:hypothetical protein